MTSLSTATPAAESTAEPRAKILVAEDDEALSVLVTYNLEAVGYEVRAVADGLDALEQVGSWQPDLLVLDWMLPGLSGVDLCRRLRARGGAMRDMPVLMLTARTAESDSVHALDTGADDYLTKPCGMEALNARVRALLRRSVLNTGGAPTAAPQVDATAVLRFVDVVLDPVSHRVTRAGRVLSPGPTEYRLLEFFMRNPNRVFSREDLLRSVWERGVHVESRTVDVHIRRLRRILNEGDLPDLIRTVRASGYALDDMSGDVTP
ncbi:response regulator [Komagataeibacter sp. FNDCR1]|nr:response regulator [Komagataeibacter sp. FNDCR1]